jgi:YggT family protein
VDSIAVTLAQTIRYAVQIVILLIIVRAFMSFFPRIDRHHPVVRTLDSVVDPLLRPFQRMMPPMAGLDFSPILAILTLQVVEWLLINLIVGLVR